MKSWVTTSNVLDDASFLALSGIRIRSILSAELFREMVMSGTGVAGESLAAACHERWTDLTDTLAALPEPAEGYLVLGNRRKSADRRSDDLTIVFLSAGRGKTEKQAQANCRRNTQNLWGVLLTIVDYAEFERIVDESELQELAQFLERPFVLEVRRRMETIRVSDGVIRRETVGFGSRKPAGRRSDGPDDTRVEVEQLFPWIPSNDPWRRLLETITDEAGHAAFVVHFRGWKSAPANCEEEARKTLAATERIAAMNVSPQVETVFHLQAEAIRREALRRCSILDGKLISARVFLTASHQISDALQATVESCINDPSVQQGQHGAESLFHGGALMLASSGSEVVKALDSPEFSSLFGPRESGAILRTPIPTDFELPGVRLCRSRTSIITGTSGTDAPLGLNIHRGVRTSVALDDAMRFRHTYIIGQTGTGKSTLMLNSILHDINAGRGVGVLDPHGSLIEDILLRLPESRAEDVVILDVTDVERPVGFNILRIKETDALKYRMSRDLVIDDLISFLYRTYDRETMGPMFETHFRGMMGLLLGMKTQAEPLIPNLLIFRSLYQNAELRNNLKELIGTDDILTDELIAEITSTTGEWGLHNMAPYITSKFNRFVSDLSLRNITCQNETIDIDEIVNQGKILLFYLGKGRFGDQAAGLLASQIVSRIRHSVMERGTGENIRPFYLYADEFQLFADQRFNELLAEGRKFKLALTIAHQYTDQLPKEILQGVLGNVGTVIAFRVGAIDGESMESSFVPVFKSRDLTSLPNFQAYVRSFGVLGQAPFSIGTLPPLNDGNPKIAEAVRQLSRLKYGRKREEVEEEIRMTFGAYKYFEH